MDVQRVAAFSQGDKGGNPAGVVLLNEAASDADMARVAAEVGYSETAFATALDGSNRKWRVRYFAPESEVPFCGHATIALGAVLGQHAGAGTFELVLNQTTITVEALPSEDGLAAQLTSPPTASRAMTAGELEEALALFGLATGDFDERLPPAHIHGGADHFVLPLRDRARLSAMQYDLDEGRKFMRQYGVVTVMLVVIQSHQQFAARNAFASGGVLEDPATGAAAAAFAGYLRDQKWPHGGRFAVHQGEDMGQPSLIKVALTDQPNAPVKVSGSVRPIMAR
ncbi:MAG: PhzF family phenazine biosynthesis protein [Pseudomonadota bacterium]